MNGSDEAALITASSVRKTCYDAFRFSCGGIGDSPTVGFNLRFMIDDVDALYTEFSGSDVFGPRTALRDTAWGTREFAFYDPDGNGLTFYRDL